MFKVLSFYTQLLKDFFLCLKINFKAWGHCFYISDVTHFIKSMYTK